MDHERVVPGQLPSSTMETPLIVAVQGLSYVWKSQPQTGLASKVQAFDRCVNCLHRERRKRKRHLPLEGSRRSPCHRTCLDRIGRTDRSCNRSRSGKSKTLRSRLIVRQFHSTQPNTQEVDLTSARAERGDRNAGRRGEARIVVRFVIAAADGIQLQRAGLINNRHRKRTEIKQTRPTIYVLGDWPRTCPCRHTGLMDSGSTRSRGSPSC